jgi:hypothetical protein
MPSRRSEIEMTAEEVQAFVAEQMVMQCATIGPHGLPHMVPLWFVTEMTPNPAQAAEPPASVTPHPAQAAEPPASVTPHPAQAAESPASGLELLGWTYAKSQKARNLERDPRATLGIEDGVEYHELRGVMFECDVQIERDAELVAGHGLRLFDRYAPGGLTPEIREMVAKQAQKRIGLRFVPSRVVSWDHRKLGGRY